VIILAQFARVGHKPTDGPCFNLHERTFSKFRSL
jgi:hypothetical protein